MKFHTFVIAFLYVLHSAVPEELRLVNLDPPEAQQYIDRQDTSLKYAPKVDSNVPAVRFLGNEPHNVVEDIYLANQYHGQDGLGGYLYGYAVPDIAKTEKKKAGGDLRGAYNYIAGNGQEIKVEYWDDGSGFHQVDNVPKILPKQIDDTPEVKAAKEEHQRIWHEQAERNSRPIANPYDSQGNYAQGPLSPQGQQQTRTLVNQYSQQKQQFPNPGQSIHYQGGQYQPQQSQNVNRYQQAGQPGQYGISGGSQPGSGQFGGAAGGGSGQSSGGPAGGSQSGGQFGLAGGSQSGAAAGSQSGGGQYGATAGQFGLAGGSQSGSGQYGPGQSWSGGLGHGSGSQSGSGQYGPGQSGASGSQSGGGQYGASAGQVGLAGGSQSGSGQYRPGQASAGGHGSQSSGGQFGQSGAAAGSQSGSGQYGPGQSSSGGQLGHTGGSQSAGGQYGGAGQSSVAGSQSGSGQYGAGQSGAGSQSGTGQYGGAGQSSGGQFGAAAGSQSGSGQYGAGQSGSGQYGAGQSGSGQYVAGQYGAGGKSGTGQYGQSGGGIAGGQYSGQASSQYSAQDEGQWNEQEEEKGPPKGFFYSFDYPVGIIVQKDGGSIQKRSGDLKDIYASNKASFEQQLHQGQSGSAASATGYLAVQ